MKKCPMCAEEIQDEAKKCKHCGEYLVEKVAADDVLPPAASEPIAASASSKEVELFNSQGVIVTSSQVKIEGGNTYAIAHINGVGKKSVDTFAEKRGRLSCFGCLGTPLTALAFFMALDSGGGWWFGALFGAAIVAATVLEGQKPMPVSWALVLTLSSSEAVAWTSNEEKTVDEVIKAIENALKK